MHTAAADARSKSRVASLSIASNTLLILSKLVVASITGSVSILSEALHSGLDLVAAGVTPATGSCANGESTASSARAWNGEKCRSCRPSTIGG